MTDKSSLFIALAACAICFGFMAFEYSSNISGVASLGAFVYMMALCDS